MRRIATTMASIALGSAVACSDDGTAAQDDDAAHDAGSASTADDTTDPTTSPPLTTADDAADDDAADESGGADTQPGTDGDDTGTPEDIETWALRAGGFAPPLSETVYSCFSFTLPVDQLHHIVGFEPVVSSPYVHHYVLSLSDTPVQLDPNESCIEWPAHILWAWGPGGEPMMLPDEAGFLVGHQGAEVTFILQVHYNNPLMTPFVDDNGVDVLVTKTLRPNRAGIFTQGDIFSIAVPPGDPAFEYVATCGSELTQAIVSEPIHVFAAFLHAHEIGSRLWTEVFRDGASLGDLVRNDPYSFDSQRFLPTDFDLQPGDRIETHCVYDSTDRTDVTMGGPASNQEMCLDFMMYYPWIPSETCGAV